jgi:hypothetical protein
VGWRRRLSSLRGPRVPRLRHEGAMKLARPGGAGGQRKLAGLYSAGLSRAPDRRSNPYTRRIPKCMMKRFGSKRADQNALKIPRNLAFFAPARIATLRLPLPPKPGVVCAPRIRVGGHRASLSTRSSHSAIWTKGRTLISLTFKPRTSWVRPSADSGDSGATGTVLKC